MIKTQLTSIAAAFMLGLAALAGTVLIGAAAANAAPGHAPSSPGSAHAAPAAPAHAAPAHAPSNPGPTHAAPPANARHSSAPSKGLVSQPSGTYQQFDGGVIINR
jgi:hypothetical protein